MVIQIIEGFGLKNQFIQDCTKLSNIPIVQSPITDDSIAQVVGIYTELGFRLTRDFLSKYKSLKFIATPTTSTTHIDMNYCRSNKIKVISLKDFPLVISKFTSTVEIAWWHLIELNRRCTKAQDSVIEGNWNRLNFFTRSFSNLNFGIVGFGRIGKQVSLIAQNFNMNVKIFEIDQSKLKDSDSRLFKCDSINEVFETCNFVVICVDDRESNLNLVNKNLLSLAKNTGLILVNVSRGFILNSQDCVDALTGGFLSGLGVDVLPEEDFNSSDRLLHDNPIIKAKQRSDLNISITPHIGGATTDSLEIAAETVFEMLIKSVIQSTQNG